MIRRVLAFIIVALIGALSAFWMAGCNACILGTCGDLTASKTGSGPTAIPTPPPASSPTPTATATPADPCKPVVGVNLSGPLTVDIGTVFKIDVTPVSPSGPLEGSLDFCNAGRFPSIESASANVRCVGSCNGFGPQFLAQGVGPFSVTIRVEGASASFSGTVR